MARTLISFLGTGDYEQALYHWDGRGEHQTIYVAAALAKLWEADRVIVPATKDAELKHRKSLEASLRAAGCPAPTFRRLPDGRTEQELWEQFEVIRKALEESSSGEILLDITHGYRAQPFFAGAILSVLRATRIEHDRIELVYGEYRKNEVSPIWDLTLFITLVDWAQALGLFVRTGVADAVVELGLNARNRLAREVASSGGRDFPRFERLVNAIENFADDLATMRVASLITGYFQDDSNKSAARGSAARLLDAIEKFQEEVSQKLPPLALILGELAERLRPLRADRLYSKEGQRAQYALARYYLALGRYPEAAAVIREARINLHAEDERGVEVNSPEYDQGQREAAEFCFNLSDDHRLEIAEVRNDIEHGGFRKQPLAADVLQDRVRKLVERFAVDDVETF